jgi:hypothetical protein
VSFQVEGGGTREYPADIQCVFSVEVPTGDTGSGADLDDDDAEAKEEVLAFVQTYDFVYGPSTPHPLVPSCPYVCLEDNFELLPATALLRPALLVPNVLPSAKLEPGGERKSILEGSSVVRPHFFWVEVLF